MDTFAIIVKTESRRRLMGRMTWAGRFSRILCSLALAAILAQLGLPVAEAGYIWSGATTDTGTAVTTDAAVLDTTTAGYIWSGATTDGTTTLDATATTDTTTAGYIWSDSAVTTDTTAEAYIWSE